MSSAIDKVKNVLHLNKDKDATSTTHTTDAHNTTGTHTTGTHATGTHTGTTHNTIPEGTAGPHSSRVANAADPRIDSDLDSTRHTGSGVGGIGSSTHTGTTHGTTGLGSSTHGTHTGTTGTTGIGSSTHGSSNYGPHDSNLANKADPRVDSDLDGSRRVGNTTGTTTHGTTGLGSSTHGTHGTSGLGSSTHGTSGLGSSTHGTTGLGSSTHGTHTGTTGLGSSTHGTHTGTTGLNSSTHGSSNYGPHDSSLANKADPRVDSDLDGSRRVGNTTGTTGSTGYSGTHGATHTGTHTGTTGGLSHSTNAGPHDSNVANKADPRVDSDLDGRGNRHGASTGGVLGTSGSHATPGSGTAQNTAGPHNSDLANKLDPRVDSDRDGSKTIGGNKTHA